jgi:O-acetyl-ADP-ribose deacetylase (regulator of RNase III)
MTACSKYTNVGTGDIQTTIGGNLQCNYVIHAVCCDWNSSGEAEKVSKVFTLKDTRIAKFGQKSQLKKNM